MWAAWTCLCLLQGRNFSSVIPCALITHLTHSFKNIFLLQFKMMCWEHILCILHMLWVTYFVYTTHGVSNIFFNIHIHHYYYDIHYYFSLLLLLLSTLVFLYTLILLLSVIINKFPFLLCHREIRLKKSMTVSLLKCSHHQKTNENVKRIQSFLVTLLCECLEAQFMAVCSLHTLHLEYLVIHKHLLTDK